MLRIILIAICPEVEGKKAPLFPEMTQKIDRELHILSEPKTHTDCYWFSPVSPLSQPSLPPQGALIKCAAATTAPHPPSD